MTRLEPLPATASARPQQPATRPSTAALLPGLALTAVVVAVLMSVRQWLPQVSPLLLAIVVGAVAANVGPLPQRLQPGLQFSAKRVLRIGVALLGLQVTVRDIAGLGPGVLAVVVVIVVGGITGTLWLGRLLGLSWTQRLLIACGFSICGAAAAADVDGVVDARDEELVTTVALVVVFGTVLIGLIPILIEAFGVDARTGGIWAGGAVHEVAQVVATGGAIGGGALTVAVLVKLARVVLLAPVLAVVGLRERRLSRGRVDAVVPPLVPLFVLAFLGLVALRSTGTVPTAVLSAAGLLQTALLTAAMFALGTGVRLATLRRVGPRPLALAALSTVWVSGIALVGALSVG